MHRWPSKLWLVQHGESAGNVAREAAHAAGSEDIEIDARDIDVPLSEFGHSQAAALAHWFASMAAEHRPEVVLSSPYLRARDTANAMCGAIKAGSIPGIIADERLRKREFGIGDRLTRAGIEQRHPELAA